MVSGGKSFALLYLHLNKVLNDFLLTCLKHYKEFLRKKIVQNLIFRFKFLLVLS